MTQTARYRDREITGHDAEVDERIHREIWQCDKEEYTHPVMGKRCCHCTGGCHMILPHYTTDLNALRPVLEEIEKRGLKAQFAEKLHYFISHSEDACLPYENYCGECEIKTCLIWDALKTAFKYPHIIAVAALLTLEGE
jgi:hypothetical protein